MRRYPREGRSKLSSDGGVREVRMFWSIFEPVSQARAPDLVVRVDVWKQWRALTGRVLRGFV